jgi:sporulation protein YlmC with PRC-barrel domain
MTREPSTGRSVATTPSSSLSTDHWLASDIYKASVYDPSEHKIGDVTDLMIDSNGNVTAAIIGVGGFLGVAQKDVVIPFKELKVSTRDGKDWLVLNRTKDELKAAPAYDNTGSPSEYRGKGGDIR